jgi:hypothetical protein
VTEFGPDSTGSGWGSLTGMGSYPCQYCYSFFLPREKHMARDDNKRCYNHFFDINIIQPFIYM